MLVVVWVFIWSIFIWFGFLVVWYLVLRGSILRASILGVLGRGCNIFYDIILDILEYIFY